MLSEKTVTLNNHLKIPTMGFGTWQLPEGSSLEEALKNAIRLGYRHFDTAQIYNNGTAIAKAIHASGLPREDFFITSKLWNTHRHFEGALEAFEAILHRLDTTYLDAFLIHWPAVSHDNVFDVSANMGAWRALESLYTQGRVKAIGCSNFLPHHLSPLLKKASIKPMLNQLEIHPGYTQKAAVNFSRANNITVMAWSPLGRSHLLSEPLLERLAEKYQKSPAQIALRWGLEEKLVILPRAITPEHQAQNLAVYDFSLTPEDHQTLSEMPPCAFSGLHPDYVTF